VSVLYELQREWRVDKICNKEMAKTKTARLVMDDGLKKTTKHLDVDRINTSLEMNTDRE
jgi:hypothetical protein